MALSHAERGRPSTPPPRITRTQRGRPLLRVVARAPAGNQPKSILISPDGSLLYVCNFGRPDHESVTIHDADTLARVGMVEFPGNAVEAAFSPDGRTLYVSNFRRDLIEVIDVASRTVRSEITVGQHPKSISVSPDGATLYVTNWGGRRVSVVDVQRGVEVRQFRTGRQPRGLVVRPDGRVLVASFNSHYIQEYDAEGLHQLRRFRTCRHPRDLVMGPDPNLLFVTCTLGSVSWYDLGAAERIGLGGVGVNPRSLGITTDGRYLATANFGLDARRPGSVSVVDLQSGTHHVTFVPGVERLVGVTVHPGSSLRVYATSWDTSEIIALAP